MNHFKVILSTYIILSVFSFKYSFGQENENQLRAGGSLEVENITYFENIEEKINGRNQIQLMLDIEKQLKSGSGFFTSLEFREDFNDPTRNRVYIDEAFVNLNFKSADIKIGKQIITWGETFYINPTNNINPTDYSDILDTDEEIIGILAINANHYIGNWKFQGVYAPLFTESILPASPDSRWYREIEIDEIQLPYNVYFQDKKTPSNDLSSSQFAFLIGNSSSKVDFSFSYYRGYSNIPKIEVTDFMVSDTVQVNLRYNFFHQDVIGFDFSTTISKMGLRGEVAYFITDGLLNDYSFLRYVIGLDKTFTDLIGYNNLYIIIQWAQELIQSDLTIPNTDFIHLFRKSVLGQINLDVGMSAKLFAKGFYNIYSNELYIQPGLEYSLLDDLTLNILTDILHSKKDGFFSVYKNNRVQVRLKYSF